MDGYKGEIPLPDTFTEASWTKEQWAIQFISSYGGIDGAHHKDWVLDQVSRILHGTPVIATLAQWEGDFEEIRFRTGEPSAEYLEWVRVMESDGYTYERGIAP